LKEEVLDRTLWRTRFGSGYRPVVRQTTEWMICSPCNGPTRGGSSFPVSPEDVGRLQPPKRCGISSVRRWTMLEISIMTVTI
jgi:hypothetical protein